MSTLNSLSERSALILRLIAEGRSYDQILSGHPEMSYRDIFGAAEEALTLYGRQTGDQRQDPSAYHERLARIKSQHSRAYEKWTAMEDADLAAMQAANNTIAEMSARFQRQPSAIRSRLARLGLSPEAPSQKVT